MAAKRKTKKASSPRSRSSARTRKSKPTRSTSSRTADRRLLADCFAKETIKRFGRARLRLLLQYLDRAPEIEGSRDVVSRRIRTTDRSGSEFYVTFADATLAEMRRAVALVEAPTPARLDHLPPRAVEQLTALNERLRDALGKQAPRVRVGYRMRGRAKHVYYDLEGVPAAKLAVVSKALSGPPRRARRPKKKSRRRAP